MTASVVLRRGSLVESRHRIHVAVADEGGGLHAWAGNPDLPVFFRSAAKPFQALPLVADGVVERFEIPPEELALCCASHSGEHPHVRGVRSLLARLNVDEAALTCGPHLPLRAEAAHAVIREGGQALPVHNNCSGKHAGMLGLARHHGWPLEGYARGDHPVQRRVLEEVARWTGMEPEGIARGEDGCGVVTFGLPLVRLARAFAALGGAAGRREAAPQVVFDAMTAHPFLVSGTGRPCLEIMRAAQGSVLVKIGAEGVYCATDRSGGRGVALKVEDGSRRAAGPAIVRVLEVLGLVSNEALARLRRPMVPNTLGRNVAILEAELDLNE